MNAIYTINETGNSIWQHIDGINSVNSIAEKITEEYDIDLEEFADEIEGWIIDELKKIGCDTAKSVLELDPDELVRRTDLEEETIKEVFSILKAEFDNE
jgi:N utilization substance protein A